MKFFTEQQYQKLIENGKERELDKDHAPVVKVFLPLTNCIWLLSELDPETPNIAFGLCDLGLGFPELGYVDLEEIVETGNSLFGIPPECDQSFVGKFPMSVYATASRVRSMITEDEQLLLQASHKQKNRNKPTP